MAAILPRVGIDQNDLHKLRYNEVLTKEARDVLVVLLEWSYAGGGLTYKQHLCSTQGYTNAQYRKLFDAQQRKKLDEDQPASSFDISLLYKLLRNITNLSKDDSDWVTSTPSAPTVENLAYTLKQHRNRLAHENLTLTETNMNDILSEVQQILVDILNLAANRFNIPTTSVMQLTNTVIQNINDLRLRIYEPLGQSDISRYQQDVKTLRESLKKEVLEECFNELSLLFLRLSELDLASWLLRDDYYKPSAVFTKFTVQEDSLLGSKRKNRQTREVDCHEIFQLKHHDGSHADVIIVSGEGGMGKTTFMKYIMEQWGQNSGSLIGLDGFDLVLYVECRNPTIKSLDQLIKHLLPKTPHNINIEFQHFFDIVLQSRVLFLIDGYDEVNSTSRKLIEEILNLPGDHIQVIVTSRTVRSDEISKIVPQFKRRLNLVIQGIAVERFPDFVGKLIIALVDLQDQDEMKTKLTGYISKLSKGMGDQLRCPLILTLITLMLVECPKKFHSMTSSTSLYEELRTLLTGKLVSRLVNMGIGSEIEIEEKCEQFLQFQDYLAFRSFQRGEYEMQPETTADIRRKCDELQLPSDEIMSTYFTTRRSRPGLKIIKVYTYIHLNVLEFNASKYVVGKLTESNSTFNGNTLLKILTEESLAISSATFTGTRWGGFINDTGVTLDTGDDQAAVSNISLWKYQDILLYVSGILAHCHSELLPKYSNMIIELIAQPGNTISFLLRHVTESKYNPHFVKAVAEKLALLNTVEWKIGAVHLCALPHILAITQPNSASIVIESDPECELNLSCALTAISKCNTKLKLYFWHQLYSDGAVKFSDEHLIKVTHPDSYCMLQEFAGYLSAEAIKKYLPKSLGKLYLKLNFEDLTVLSEKLSDLSQLQWLVIVVNSNPTYDKDQIPTLKYFGKDLSLHLVSAVTDSKEDLEWTCFLVSKLWPEHRHGCYGSLHFTGTHLSESGAEQLIRQLSAQGIKASGIQIKTSQHISDEQKMQMKNFSRTNSLGHLFISS